jgi:hypothetical protein
MLEASMRTTILAALTVLLAGCGLDSDPTAPDETGLPMPEPALGLAEPQLAAAATNFWAAKAPLPVARYYAAAGVVNGLLYVAGALPNRPSPAGTPPRSPRSST